MEARILFVAPFADLFAEARTVVDEQFSGAAGHIKLIRGDLQACIGAVKQAVEDGVEVNRSVAGRHHCGRRHRSCDDF